MFRVTVKGVRGHWLRFLLTAFAVMLGVSFVAGTFVLRDSIDSTLSGLFTQALKGTDVMVRGVDAKTNTSEGGTSRAALPLTLESTLKGVDGVKRAAPDLQGTALIAGKDGTAVRNGGAPGFAFAFRADDPSFTLVKGRGPTSASEIVVEQKTLEKSKLAIGDSTTAVIGQGSRTVTVVGEVTFGSLFGATAILLDEGSARAAFAPDGTVQSFSLTAASGVSQQALRDRVAAVLPKTAEAVTGKTLEDESQSSLKTGLGFFTTFLLIFAGVSLFVGAFIILNTFSMVVAQRTRELALLRALGASRGQVLRVVLGEAAIIGLFGSALGLGLGLLITAGAIAAIRAFIGADIGSSLPVGPVTVLVSFGVGLLVTVLTAYLPARRASRIPPMAALRDDQVSTPRGLLVRGAIGVPLSALGVGLLTWGVTRADVPWPLVGLAAGLCVIGLLVAAPLTARPVVGFVGAPFRLFGGVVGKMAQENSLRVPRRTALTASALMIGLALISGFAVLASSVKASVADIVARELTSDFVLSGGNAPLPAGLAAAAAKLPAVQSAATVSGVGVKVGSVDLLGQAATAQGLGDNFVITMRSGSLAVLDQGQVLISESAAKDHAWKVGTVLDASVGTLTGQKLTVGGVFKDSQALGTPMILGRALYEKALPEAQRADFGVYLKAKPGADLTALRADLTAIAKPYLTVSVQDGAEFRDSAAGGIDTLLNLLYVLLLFSVIVAVLGIVNTLALSVFERTREIGLMRAVGLRRRQLSQMITIEAVTTAVFGAVLGCVLGLGLGTAVQHALRTQGLDVLSIPWGTVITVLIASAIVGVVAAVLPSVRAVRLNILQAIATE